MNGILKVSGSGKTSSSDRALPGGHHLAVSTALVFLLLMLLTVLPMQVLGQERQLGPVSADQTLWSIASQTRPDPSITVYQYMLALVEANPHAFAAGNVNLLREGVILDLPDADFATRVSPEEAQRRVDEQMQWYADLSRQELLAVLRSEPELAPDERAVEPVQPVEPVEPVEQIADVPEAIVEEDVSAEEPAVSSDPEPIAEVGDWAEEEAVPGVAEPSEAEQPLVGTEPVEVEPLAWPDDPIAEPAPDMPEQLEALDPVGEAVETGVPAPLVEATEPMDWPAEEPSVAADETMAQVPVEPLSEQPSQPDVQQPAAAPPPMPATPPDRSVLVWLLVAVVVLGLAGFLVWWFVWRKKQSASEPAEADQLDDVDESSFPTAAAAAAAGSGVAAIDSPASAAEAGAKPSGTGTDTWSGFEAAVIGGGPVPVGDPDPDSEPDRPEPSSESDAVLPDQSSTVQEQVDETSADDVEASFKIEELGWFEDDGFSMDESSSSQKTGAEQTDDIIGEIDDAGDDMHEKPPANVSFDDVDLASFRADQDADQETSDQDASSSVPEDEFDLAEFRDAPEPEPEPVDRPESEFEQLPDLDWLDEQEEDAKPEAERVPNFEPGLDLDLEPESESADVPAPVSAPDVNDEQATDDDDQHDLNLDWDDELDSLSDPQPEAQSETQPEPVDPGLDEASAPALDDDEAEVMLDLARLTADAGDADYAQEVLDEIIATASEEMANRARQLKGELGNL